MTPTTARLQHVSLPLPSKPPIVHNVCERSRGVCVRVRVLCVYCMRTCAQTVSLCVCVCWYKKKQTKKTVHSNATATAETDLMEGTDFWRQNTKKDRLPNARPRDGTSSPCRNVQELTLLICCVLSRLSLLTSYGEKNAADPTARTLTERRKFVPDLFGGKTGG